MESNEKILNLKCYQCEKPFSFRAQFATGEAPDNLVDMVIPCPYCETPNQFKLREDQIPTQIRFKSPEKSQAPVLPDDEFWDNHIFDGAKSEQE